MTPGAAAAPSAEGRKSAGFLLKLFVGVAVIILIDRLDLLAPVLEPVALFMAWVTAGLLEVIGLMPLRHGTVIGHPAGFAYEVHYRCTCIVPAAILSLGLVLQPFSAGRKAIALSAGLGVLVIINQIRLVHLFVVGVMAPQQFTLMHDIVWQSVMILSGVTIFAACWMWARRRPGDGGPTLGRALAGGIAIPFALATALTPLAGQAGSGDDQPPDVALTALAANAERYLDDRVTVVGRLDNVGTNYFTDLRVALRDPVAPEVFVYVRPWLPVELPPGPSGARERPPVLSDYLAHMVELIATVRD